MVLAFCFEAGGGGGGGGCGCGFTFCKYHTPTYELRGHMTKHTKQWTQVEKEKNLSHSYSDTSVASEIFLNLYRRGMYE